LTIRPTDTRSCRGRSIGTRHATAEHGTQQIARDFAENHENVTLVVEPWEKGTHGKARNLLVEHARGEYVAFTDGDCLVARDWLRRRVTTLLSEIEQDPAVVAAGGIRRPAEGGNWQEGLLNTMLGTCFGSGGSKGLCLTARRYVDSLANYNVIYTRQVLRREKYSALGFGEDYELNRRLGRRGYKIAFIPSACVYHSQQPSFGAFAQQMFRYGHGQVNTRRAAAVFRCLPQAAVVVHQPPPVHRPAG
jgi:cellulose synthase/poly-beta-1,6-N-acetylglucosamine synthase-like glycosyltransferase